MRVPPILLRLCTLLALSTPFAQGVGPAGAHYPSTWLHGILFQAGPMVGHVSDSSAKIWLRAKRGAVITAVANQGNERFRPSRIESLESGFYIVHFSGLQAASQTEVTLELSRDTDAESETVSFRTAPAPARTGTVRLAFGSCSKIEQYGGAPIYDAIADEQPDFSIFVGDNIYFMVADGSEVHFRGTPTRGPIGDWNFFEAMVARHLRTRTDPDLRRMLRTVPSYAVWDDHDYGPDNADSRFELKEEAKQAFVQVWANPSYGTRETPGIFSSFRHGPVEVFLMDVRYHKLSHLRHPEVTRETGRIWGDAQLQWLMQGLKASDAPVKLIANGTQFLSMTERGEGHYQEAQGEQRTLLEFLEREKIGGVVFLTGDRHYSEAIQQAQPGGTLVVECTSSPLQQGQTIAAIDPARALPNPNQLWSMRGNSYGLVTIDIQDEGAGTVRFEARDEQNQAVVIDGSPRATTWNLEQLEY